MTIAGGPPGSDLARRLARFRAAPAGGGRDHGRRVARSPRPTVRARRPSWRSGWRRRSTARSSTTPTGRFVRVEGATDRDPGRPGRLAGLPGQPPADAPLVCLDTETTGLATAAGTVAFLIGLGWWEGRRSARSSSLLPDHADEPALLDELAAPRARATPGS